MRVLKFGGTSLADAGRIAGVAALVSEAAARERAVVVVSALAGVTDALVEAADAAADGEPCAARVEALERRHLRCLDALATGGRDGGARATIRARVAELHHLLGAAAARRRCAARDRDSVLAAGERLSVVLVALALRAAGVEAEAVDATELVRTDSRFGEARVDAAATEALIRRRLGAAGDRPVPVVTGFVGADAAGRTTTLGRGGSDYSASLVGAALGASVVEIWTDVNGVLSGPPLLLPGARTVPELSYEEAAELAFFGAKVLHRETMRPLAALGIPIAVRNTFAAGGAATLISRAPATLAPGPAAVTAVEKVELLTAEPGGDRRAGSHGVHHELASAGIEPLASARASADATVSAAVHADCSGRAVATLRRGWAVATRGGLSLVAVVGHGLGRGPALGGSALTALAAERVPLVAAWAGSSPHSFAALVERRDLPAALAALHGRLVARTGAEAR